jgi:hypothetical protein
MWAPWARLARQAADLLRHLLGQLACRAQHQRLHRHAAGRVQIRQQRQCKRGSLAAACLGLGDQVLAGECQRQAGRLDRRHALVAQPLQVGQRGGEQRQAAEGRAGGRCAFGGGIERNGRLLGKDAHARLSGANG